MAWLVASLIINNGYKGIAKSNYMLQTKYTTNWTNLLQLSEFKLYFAHGEGALVNCSGIQTWLQGDVKVKFKGSGLKHDWLTHIRSSFYALLGVDVETRATFALVNELENLEKASGTEFQYQIEYTKWLTERTDKLKQMRKNADVICVSSLEDAMGDRLAKPRSAFVTPAEYQSGDWLRFLNVMRLSKRKKRVKFATNFAVEDTTLRAYQGYYVTGRLSMQHREVVLKRIRMVMGSGIHSLWKRWDRMRQLFHLPKVNGHTVVALSFDNSDIHLLFTVFGVFLSSALTALLCELALCRLSSRFVNHNWSLCLYSVVNKRPV